MLNSHQSLLLCLIRWILDDDQPKAKKSKGVKKSSKKPAAEKPKKEPKPSKKDAKKSKKDESEDDSAPGEVRYVVGG